MPPTIDIKVWALIGQWVLYGSSLTGAIMGIAKFANWCLSKTTVARLELEIQKHSEYLNNDNQRIKQLESQAKNVDEDLKDIHKLLQLSIKSNQALLKSQLDGNNRDNIKKVSEEIEAYLNEQI